MKRGGIEGPGDGRRALVKGPFSISIVALSMGMFGRERREW